MRILQIADLYPPVIGGTERHTQRLAIELANRGHDSAVATLRVAGAAEYEIGAAGERVYRMSNLASAIPGAHPSGRPHHPPFADPAVTRQLAAIVATERPDVVYAHNWIIYSYLPLQRRFDIPLVYVLHDYCMSCPAKTALRPDHEPCDHLGAERRGCAVQTYGRTRGTVIDAGLSLSNRRLVASDCTFVAISQSVADVSRVALGPDRPIHVIPTFIADGWPQRASSLSRPAALPDEPYILYVGAAGAHKGADTLLRAYAALDEPKPRLVLFIAGHDDLTELPPGAEVFRDMAHDDVMAAWRDCLFGVVPSRWPEPFGQVAVEALTMGRPIIVSDSGGLRDLVHEGQNGLRFPPGSEAALTTAMNHLVSDAAERERMGANAAASVTGLTVSAVADSIEELLGQLVADTAARAARSRVSPSSS